jgi:uncharacterized protein
LLAAAVLAACSAQEEPPAFPYYEAEGGRVRDGADILSPAAEHALAARLYAAEASYGPQLAIVTVESLHGYSIEDFSLLYARAWGLGDGDRNDGLLLLVAPDERRVRIEVGKGLEETFTDLYCKDVLDAAIMPRFRQGDMEAGVIAGVEALIDRMRKHPTIPANDNAPGEASVKVSKAA